MTWSELASVLHLSAPSTAERVKRLEEKGYIKGYTAQLNYPALGFGLTAFIAVTFSHPRYRVPFLKAVNNLPEASECHHIAGEDDYLLKVRCQNTQHLDELLNKKLKSLPGIARTKTTIALSTLKETERLP
jgi:Lrp/AsnC family leucine-responsive transcriptional regulator